MDLVSYHKVSIYELVCVCVCVCQLRFEICTYYQNIVYLYCNIHCQTIKKN